MRHTLAALVDLSLIPLAGLAALLSALMVPLLAVVTTYAVAWTSGSILGWWAAALGFAGVVLCVVNAAALLEAMHRPSWPAIGWVGTRIAMWSLIVLATSILSTGHLGGT